MFNRARRVFRIMLTTLLLAAAAVAVVGLYQHYMVSPWTRDGQVRVYVANIAPQVSGQIVDVRVYDNQFVHKGDLLYVIDQTNFKVADQMAQANVSSRKADLDVKRAQAARREELTTLSTSIEEKQRYAGDFSVAQATYESALANLKQAKINLERTEVRSTVNGYATNLLLRVGDYATTGTANISIIDADSFWVSGYFEETKLGSFQVGDAADVELMGFSQKIKGHVESITRGISTANAAASTQGLPAVSAVYTWVRLAQRIPVRIHIDNVPPGIVLAAGETATVIVYPDPREHTTLWDDIRRTVTSTFARI